MTAPFKIQIVQGDDVSIVINATDKTAAAIDLTGVTALTFKVRVGTLGTTYITKTLGSGVTITNAAAGEITVALLSPTDTGVENMPAGDYLFELQITDSAGNISTIRDFNDDLGVFTVLADLDGS